MCKPPEDTHRRAKDALENFPFVEALCFPGICACLFSFPAVLCLIGIRANAQANVTENESTYIYVDANNGSDGNSGSSGSPLQTTASRH